MRRNTMAKPMSHGRGSKLLAPLWLTLLLVAAASAGTNREATPPPSSTNAVPASLASPAVAAVEAIGTTVADLDRAVQFYTGILGFAEVQRYEIAGSDVERLHGIFGVRLRRARLRLGDELVELTEYTTPRGRTIPEDSRSNDRWFQHIAIVVADMDRAYEHLRSRRVEYASTEPQRLPDWNPNAGGIRAFYFKDPDGHTLEIIWFPPDKGDPRWQRRADPALFLGIDHTAIVSGDTEASLTFYRDQLGMQVVGSSENHGDEQEHLNNVFGARLRITTLRAADGPGIELLEYLTPRDGRPSPSDLRANDIAHWQTTLVCSDLEATVGSLLHRRAVFVSPGIVRVTRSELGFSRGCLIRDPDGHAMQVVSDSQERTSTRSVAKGAARP